MTHDERGPLARHHDNDSDGDGDPVASGGRGAADPGYVPERDTESRHHEHRDELPADLDVSAYVGQYTFPDIRRRRRPGLLYLGVSAACFVLWITRHGADPVYVNSGLMGAAIVMAVFGAYHLATAWPLAVRETDALVAAARHVRFPVGHASGQLGWRGLRSRPVWRILLYSSENPPLKRGLVMVDAVDGTVVEHFVEDNPEDWVE